MSKIQCCQCHQYFEYDQLDNDLICRSCNSTSEKIYTYCQCGQGISYDQHIKFRQCYECNQAFLNEPEPEIIPISGYLRPI